MINKEKLKIMITDLLPGLDDYKVEVIVDDIIRNGESIIHSLVRQAVNQEKQKLFRENNWR